MIHPDYTVVPPVYDPYLGEYAARVYKGGTLMAIRRDRWWVKCYESAVISTWFFMQRIRTTPLLKREDCRTIILGDIDPKYIP